MTPTKDPAAQRIRALSLFTADHAVVENGKVYVNGAFWTRLNMAQFPAVHPSLAIVAAIEIPAREYLRDHAFVIELHDADGNVLPPRIEGQFRIGAAPDLRVGDPTVMPLAGIVNNLMIERAGDYSFVLKVDGDEIARYTIRAVQAPLQISVGGPTPEG